jgi:L-ascorbate metabolism protein UlaG (beta-lactamase superfamily)
MELDFLKWIGHASFLIKVGNKNVYIDPFRLTTVKERADVILITHPHFDHMNTEDIAKIADSKTEIFVTEDSVDKIKVGKVKGTEPNREYSSSVIKFSTIPAYNVVKERLDKHPKKNNWVGYILEANNMKIYHAGDTDFIPEMEEINVDLALIPMSGTYTMDPDQAIEAANKIDAKAVAPMHYRAVLGLEKAKAAEEKFRKNVKNGIILKEVQEPLVF